MGYKQSSPVVIDNLELDGNTFSSLNTNGNISLEPNGSGAVVVPSNNLYVGSAAPSNPYNISIESSTAGAMGESIQNTSVGATAAATLQIIVEPATADPYTLYNVNGAATYSIGIDNSDSDQLKITTGSSPSGGTTAINVTSAGVVTLPGGALDVPSGGTGATTLTDHGVLVGSGTAAITPLTVGTDGQLLIGSSAADPVFATATSTDSLLTLTGGAGSLDITANQAVSASSTLTDNLVIRGDGGTRGVQTSTVSITDNGEMTNASQPAFLAILPSTDNNATGDSTTYTLGGTTALTEIFDQNGDFVTTGTFTAPVTGRYYLGVAWFVTGGTAITAGDVYITTSNRFYRAGTSSAPTTEFYKHFATFCDMDALDTATFTLALVDSGGKIDDIIGASPDGYCYCYGNLVC